MAIAATLNAPQNLVVAFKLGDAPGTVDTNSPITWSLNPPESGTLAQNPDGMGATVTMTAIGEATISVKADANLAAGVLDLTVSEVIQTVEAAVIGSDGGTISVAPAS